MPLLTDISKKLRELISQGSQFVQQNPTPYSYIQNRINPPVVSPLQQPTRLQQMSPQIQQVARNMYSGVSPATSIVNMFKYQVPQAQQKLQSIGQNRPMITNAALKLEQPVNRVKQFLSQPYNKISLPEMPSTANPVAKIGYNVLAKPIAEGVINAPANYVGGITRTGLNIGRMARGEKVPIQKTLGDVGSVADAILNVAILPGATGIARNAATNAMERGFKQVVGEGALSGMKWGGGFGLAQGLIDNKDVANLFDYIVNVGASTAIGTGAGGVLGAGTAGVSYGIGKVFGTVVRKLQEIFPNKPKEQIVKEAKIFFRDEAGRFVGGWKQKNANSAARLRADKTPPKIGGQEDVNSQLRESIGLPKDGKYNSGAIDLNASIGKPQAPTGVGGEIGGVKKVSNADAWNNREEAYREIARLKQESAKVLEVNKENYLFKGDLVKLKDSARQKAKVLNDAIGEQIKIAEDATNILNPKVSGGEIGGVGGGVPRTTEAKIVAGSTSVENVKARINAKVPETKAQKNGFGWFDEIKRRLINEYGPVEKVGQIAKKKGVTITSWENPEYLVKRNLGSTGIAEGELLGMGDIIKPHAKEIDNLNAYLVAKRAVDLSGREIETGIKLSDAQATVQQLSPQFEATAQKLYMYQRSILRNYLVDTGMLSEKSFQEIIAANPNYVPFKRLFAEAGMEFVPQKGVRNPLKKIKGSEREILNPLESMIENTYKVVTSGEQNRLWRSVANIGNQIPELGIRKIPTQSSGANTISFFENGKKVFYEVPKEIAAVANNLGQASNIFFKILSFPTKVVRTGATGSNPEFALLRNPIKDQFSALWNSESGYVPFVDMLKGISHFSGNDNLYRQYLLSGGSQSFMVSLDRTFKAKTLNELLSGKVIIRKGNVLSKLQDLSQLSEIGTRLGEFGKSLERTHDPLIAGKASREVTVDFGKIGKDFRVANQLIPFINARVQGTIQAVKSAMKHPARAAVIGMGLGSLPATLLYLHNRQYPEWNDIQDYEKKNNWIVLHGEPGKAKVFEIPKDYIVGQLFGNVTENMLTYMDKTDPNSMKKLAENIWGFVSPVGNVGEMIPAAVKPMMEHAFNYNTFLGRPLVPEYQKNLPPEAQYNKGTREISKLIGSKIGVSPNIIDNYLYGYLPGVFTMAINLVDFALGGNKLTDVAKLPFARVFTVSGTGKIDQEVNNAYYGIQDTKATLSGIAKNQNYSPEQKQRLLQIQIQKMGGYVNKLNNYIRMQKGETGVQFAPPPTTSGAYTPPGVAKPVSAAETTANPNVEMDDFAAIAAKEQLRFSDQTQTQVGNTVFYKQPGWVLGDDINKVDLQWTPPTLKETGIEELDKLALSTYKSDLTARMKEIGTLLNLGTITQEDALSQVEKITALQDAVATPKKPAKVTFKKISAPGKVTLRSLAKGRTPTVKIRKFKPKKLAAKNIKLGFVTQSKTYKITQPPKIRGLTQGVKLV